MQRTVFAGHPRIRRLFRAGGNVGGPFTAVIGHRLGGDVARATYHRARRARGHEHHEAGEEGEYTSHDWSIAFGLAATIAARFNRRIP